jgi:hypothetical protein
LPNLLSLDAPIVAVLWQLLFARSYRVAVPWPATILLAASVWVIYVADRLLDALNTQPRTLRHLFHRSHFRGFILCLGLCILAALFLLLTKVDAEIRSAGIPMLAAMAGYFALVHAAPQAWQRYWPKELAMAILFALGTCLPVYAESPSDGPAMLPALALFAALCWINAVAIDRWERNEAVQWLVPLALLAGGLALSLSLTGHPWLYRAASLAAASLAWLARPKRRIALEKRRVLADAVLAAPALSAWLLLLR